VTDKATAPADVQNLSAAQIQLATHVWATSCRTSLVRQI
jgi:hypothetical protein